MQQDNNSKYSAKPTLEWFIGKYLNVLEWSRQSPDLNPDENRWYDLNISAHHHNLKELEQFGLEV